jgi:hypothetical protein
LDTLIRALLCRKGIKSGQAFIGTCAASRPLRLTRIEAVETLRRIAFETVLRACGFASLTIFCFMVGLSFHPRVSFQSGGFLTTVMVLVLLYKAREARTKPYRRTEMWLYLSKDERPPDNFAQWAVATVMRDTYLVFAKWSAMVAIVMWVLALLTSIFGIGPVGFDRPSI